MEKFEEFYDSLSNDFWDLVKFVMCDLVSRELREQEGNNFVKKFSLTLGYINCTLRKGTVFVPLYEG